ncbi:uncharacterized protein LOC113795206 [Dermatophagoides pteronyssinus]|uniref:uncharacterized protein LOC113795206 n=1 Tax=Dermatophagoides pteronyssinus TaxID=6956 RepID=UPI003F66AD36
MVKRKNIKFKYRFSRDNDNYNSMMAAFSSINIIIFLIIIISTVYTLPIDKLRDNQIKQKSISRSSSSSTLNNNTMEQRMLTDTMNELEWLLHQLIDLLTDMVDGIENDQLLLQDNNFRKILIQVIKRIDFILQHFENSIDPTLLTNNNIENELNRLDCIRIRLANYLSQSRRFDDSKCYPLILSTTTKPSSSSTSTNNDEIIPVLTQIVSLLVQISQQLYHIENDLHGNRIGMADPSSTTTTESTMTNNRRSTIAEIDWDRLFNQTGVTSMPDYGTTFDFDHAINGDNQSMTTGNWSDLISQIMNGMSTTTTMSNMVTSSTTTTTTTMGTMTTNWEDMMNEMIRDFNQQQQQIMNVSGSNTNSAHNNNNNNNRPNNIDMNVDECISNILGIIDAIQNQTTTTTTI